METPDERMSELESQIAELMEEYGEIKNEYSYFREKYTVFNHDIGSVDDETFVLSPVRERDLEYLKSYCETLKDGVFKDVLSDWLTQFDRYRCRARAQCAVVPNKVVCCLYCDRAEWCDEVCHLVDTRQVNSIGDCEVGK